MYILTCSLPLTKNKLSNLKKYVNTIVTTLQEIPKIILVFTFLDKTSIEEKILLEEIIIELRNYNLDKPIKKILFVSNQTNKGINKLAKIILQLANRLPQFAKKIPSAYQYLEENINSFKLSNEYRPIITSDQINLLLQQSGIPLQEKDISLKYLHDQGIIIYWNSEHINLSDYIFLDYNLLFQMFNKIIKYNTNRNQKQIIMNYENQNENQALSSILIQLNELSTYVWNDYGEQTQKYVRLLFERFEILSLTTQENVSLLSYLIPFHRPLTANALPKQNKRKVWRRIYSFTYSYLPCILYTRIINAIIGLFPKVLVWQNGILFTKNADLNTVIASEIGYFKFNYLLDYIYFEIPIGWSNLYINKISTIIEEIISPFRDIQYKILIPCNHCIKKKRKIKNSYHFSIIELCLLAEQNCKNVYCYYNRENPFLISMNQLVNDISLKKIKHLQIRSSDLIFDKQIGSGTYGRVYKAIYHNVTVAVKILNKIDEDEMNLFDQNRLYAEFRREVQFMSDLHDPHLIQLRGVASIPDFCVVQEYCPVGDLHHYLFDFYKKNQFPPPLGYCLHIAYDISKGMEYLHSYNPPILHRDLKSPNVLLLQTVEDFINPVNNAYYNMAVIAKITDFGLSSQCNLPYSSRIVDNPLWLAPEIMDGSSYTKKVDVYSFGIILYELISCKIPFSEYNISFTTKLEEMVKTFSLFSFAFY